MRLQGLGVCWVINNMGVYLSEPNTQKDTHSGESDLFKYTSCEMQGWRKHMEDARICNLDVEVGGRKYNIFGVFDGHGGFEVSKFVEKHFIEQLLKNQEFNKGNVQRALEQNFRKMDEILESVEGNKELLEIRGDEAGGYGDNVPSNAGCTANVVVIDSEFYYCANSGDSRSVLSRAGRIVSLSEDHKPECDIEKRRIEKAGGAIINGRVNGGLNLTRAIGDLEYKKVKDLDYKEQMITCHPDVKKVPRDPQDQFILMGCDGICQPLIDIVGSKRKQESNRKVLIEQLLDQLLAKSTFEEVGCDNMTAILIDIKK